MNVNTTREGQGNIWENAARAWVLLKVEKGFDKDQVAERILNSHAELIPENKPTSRFITRADVVTGEFDIVVPLYGQDLDALDEIITSVIKIDGIDQESCLVAKVETHHPFPPHKARGYIPRREVNPRMPGITGSNAWG
ncbi:MAG: Lrp/AsnC ligand binding domain-containing protein [Anaerolineales bacterium]